MSLATYRRQIRDLQARVGRRMTPRAPYTLTPAELFTVAVEAEPDPWQAALLENDTQPVLLNCSRQAGKSTAMAVLAVDTLLRERNALVIVTSGSSRQSKELLRTITQVYVAADLGARRVAHSATRLELSNGSRAIALPTSATTVRGYSKARLVLCDESAFQPDTLYRALRPMLAVSGGRMVCGSTPFGKRGYFFQEWTEGGADWQRITVPATEVPRITPAFLAAERRSMGDLWYAQEYENAFIDSVFAVFSYDAVMAAVSDDIIPLAMRGDGWHVTP